MGFEFSLKILTETFFGGGPAPSFYRKPLTDKSKTPLDQVFISF